MFSKPLQSYLEIEFRYDASIGTTPDPDSFKIDDWRSLELLVDGNCILIRMDSDIVHLYPLDIIKKIEMR